MDEEQRAMAARQIDAILEMSEAARHLRGAVEQLHGSVTQLTALALRLERRLDDVPAE